MSFHARGRFAEWLQTLHSDGGGGVGLAEVSTEPAGG